MKIENSEYIMDREILLKIVAKIDMTFLLCSSSMQLKVLHIMQGRWEDKLEGIWTEKRHNWGYMENSAGDTGENKEISQSITSFSWPILGLDLSNRRLEFCCYHR